MKAGVSVSSISFGGAACRPPGSRQGSLRFPVTPPGGGRLYAVHLDQEVDHEGSFRSPLIRLGHPAQPTVRVGSAGLGACAAAVGTPSGGRYGAGGGPWLGVPTVAAGGAPDPDSGGRMMHVLLAPRVATPVLALMVIGCGFLERPLERGARLMYRSLVAWVTRGGLLTELRAGRHGSSCSRPNASGSARRWWSWAAGPLGSSIPG